MAVLLTGGCCALVATAAVDSPAAAAPGAAAGPIAAQRTGDDLFVQTAGGGTLTRVAGRRGVFRLVLTGAQRQVTVFSDRPQRRAGSELLAAFVRRWRSRGFASDPPNAALVLADAPASRDVVILELSRPRRGPRSISYLARVIRGASTSRLRRFAGRADSRVGARFGEASLFIDSAAATFPDVQLTVSMPRTPIMGTLSAPLIFSLVTPAGPSAQIDSGGGPNYVQLNSPGPISFSLAIGGSGFLISSLVGAPAEVALTVTPLRDPIVGTVFNPAANMTIKTPSGATFPVTNMRFSIPVDAALP